MSITREHTYLDVLEWAKKGADLGAGEILLTSVDNEGTRRGFDVDLWDDFKGCLYSGHCEWRDGSH